MAQPQWITLSGSLGTVPEGIFYQLPLFAEDPEGGDVFFRLIAGQLPDGIQVRKNGVIEGVPKAIASIQGVPQEVARDVTSKFAVRAYTEKVVNGLTVIDRLADRTFTITVTGQDVPDFVTPAGNIGTFYDGEQATVQVQFTDPDPDDQVRCRLFSGELPPGMVLDARTGLISGIIRPASALPPDAIVGYDATPYDLYPYAFSSRYVSKNYQFTLELTDGKNSNTRQFEIFVRSRDTLTADNTLITADTTTITADETSSYVPILITPQGDLGRIRSDNFYAFRFEAINFNDQPFTFELTEGAGVGFDATGTVFDEDGIGFDQGNFSLPPGLTLDPVTGWFYGYIPDQGATEQSYQFAIRVRQTVTADVYNPALTYTTDSVVSYIGFEYVAIIDVPAGVAPTNDAYWFRQPEIISPFYYFTMTIVGNTETEVIWITQPDLGTIDNGAVSMLAIEAYNVGGRPLEYRLAAGSDSQLPQGLRLLPSGNIVGKVSFNTFALDGGTTTFDIDLNTRLGIDETTFDMQFDFTVNAFSPITEDPGYQVARISVVPNGPGENNNGTGYGAVALTFSAPTMPGGVTATGIVTLVNGSVTSVTITNPGFGYASAPTVTFAGPPIALYNPLLIYQTGALVEEASQYWRAQTVVPPGTAPGTSSLYWKNIVSSPTAQGVAVLSGDRVASVTVTNGGVGYAMPIVTLSAPPDSSEAVQATAGNITTTDGSIMDISVGNPGRGYQSPPTVTITGSGSGAKFRTEIELINTVNAVSVFRRFSITVVRKFNEPYNRLYIKAMPPFEDRALIDQLIYNQNVIPDESVYRADDQNFGVAKCVVYDHAYGLRDDTIDAYANSLDINHYWKNLTLGEIRLAQAINSSTNTVAYEVIYSQIIDDQVNSQGQSVAKEITWPYPIQTDDSTPIEQVYPNSLINMRDQVIDVVGQVSPALPLWMTSKQANGKVLGFTPAWVIAYIKPGQGARALYRIQQQFGEQLNKIDFKADRYEIDRSQTHNWNPVTDQWIPHPAQATTFDAYTTLEYQIPLLGISGRITSTLTATGNGVTASYTITPGPQLGALVVTVNDITKTYGPTQDYITVSTWNTLTVIFNVPPSPGSAVKIYQIADTYTLDPLSSSQTATEFDGGSTMFISPADQYLTQPDQYDKYLLYPRTNILG